MENTNYPVTNRFLSMFSLTRENSTLTRIMAGIDRIKNSWFFSYILLALIVLLATVLRMFSLGSYSFWIDEVITLHRARAVLDGGLPAVLQNQPSTTMISLALAILPTSEWSARIVPALIGIVSLPLLFFPMRRLYGTTPALIACFVLALSQWHITWSQNARFYTTLMLFYALGLLYFVISFEERKPGFLILAGLFLILAYRERATALLAVPVIFSYLVATQVFFREKKDQITPRNVILITVIPVLLFILYDIAGVLVFGRESVFFQFYARFVGVTNDATFGALGLILAIIFRMGIPLVCISTIGAVYLLIFKLNSRSAFLLIATLVPLILLVVLATFSLARERYYVFAGLPFWALLTGIAISKMMSRPDQYAKIVAVGLVGFLFLDGMSTNMLYYFYQNGNRPDYRAAYEIVASQRSSEAHIVTTHHQQLIVEYYLGEEAENAYDVDIATLDERTEPVWFVVEPVAGPTPPDLLTWLDANARLVEVIDVDIPAAPERLKIYAYGEEAFAMPGNLVHKP